MATTSHTVRTDRVQAAKDSRGSGTRSRRRTGLLAGGVMVAAFGGLLTAWLVAAAGGRTDVLVVARDVPYGATLVAEDLTPTAVSVDALVDSVPAADLATVVGKVAAVDLLAGGLLTPGQVTADTPPGPGEVLVPLPVPAERVPAGGLRAGDRLLVVDAPSVGSDPLPVAPETFKVTLVRVGEPDMNGLRVLDVAAAQAEGPSVATRAASGRFALVLLDAGSGQ